MDANNESDANTYNLAFLKAWKNEYWRDSWRKAFVRTTGTVRISSNWKSRMNKPEFSRPASNTVPTDFCVRKAIGHKKCCALLREPAVTNERVPKIPTSEPLINGLLACKTEQ